MGEIRIVSPGKTHGYPYPVCKKKWVFSRSSGLTKKILQSTVKKKETEEKVLSGMNRLC